MTNFTKRPEKSMLLNINTSYSKNGFPSSLVFTNFVFANIFSFHVIFTGNAFMKSYGLFPRDSGFSTDYSNSFDPRINNEFAGAAFRSELQRRFL